MSALARASLACILLLAAACAPAPWRATIPSTWFPSPNHDGRRPDFVVIHHTGDDTAAQALATLTSPAREVSAHYLVARDGTLYQLVDERYRAWHAGVSRWASDEDINSESIGIELDNDGEEPFPDVQIDALLALLADIEARYHIPRANFVGHADVAPGRKVDPSKYFPWRRLAESGFGLWCDDPPPEPPPGFDATLALQALGYDVSDVPAAIRAFGLHYLATDEEAAPLSPQAQGLLACLVEEARQP